MCNDSEEPQASILARIVDRHLAAASSTSLACWLVAVAILALHAKGAVIRTPVPFMLTEGWLIGIGCVGVPAAVLNLLGRHLSPRSLELIAAASFTSAALTTVFVATGLAHISAWTACFVFILLLALGIHALNGSYALARRASIARQVRAEERAERARAEKAAYLGALMDAHQAQHRRAEQVEKMLEMPTEELVDLQAALEAELQSRRIQHLPVLGNGHVVPLFGDRRLPPTGSESE